MNATASDALAELTAMRARGEISAEEFTRARQHLATGEANTETTPQAKPLGKRKPSIVITFLWIFLGMSFLAWLAPNDRENLKAARLVREPDGVKVVATVYGDDWPYPPYASGIIECKPAIFGQSGGYQLKRTAVIITLGGTEYGLNGAALNAGFPDPRPFMPTDGYGIFKGRVPTIVDKFLQIGQSRCR